ncbi:MAG: 23S rRNA (adenine2503-C2)-methyltransferase, partial [Bacillariaceae sp.]
MNTNTNNKILIIMAFCCSYFLIVSSSVSLLKRATTTTTTTTTTTRRFTGIVLVEAFIQQRRSYGQQRHHHQTYSSGLSSSSSPLMLSSLLSSSSLSSSSSRKSIFSYSSSIMALSSSTSTSTTTTAAASSEETTKLSADNTNSDSNSDSSSNNSNTSNTSNSNTSNLNSNNSNTSFDLPLLNLHTITYQELETLILSWGYPKFRSKQIYYDWIRSKGITNPNDMINIPKSLRSTLIEFTSLPSASSSDNNDEDNYNDNDNEDNIESSKTYDNFGGGSLQLEYEAISKDGTRKRAYRLRDNQLIESVLMGPYNDGRYTACISSQAGCAMGCIFCATGQMGFARQLTSNEIYEQVSRFCTELKKESIKENNTSKRLSNIVFMGMGEPLANYKNVVQSINRINIELGIGARKITVSTVGVVPNIRKLFTDDTDMPQVRLAVSLHCANDEERSKLLPANDRYGGLHELMTCLRDYIDKTGRRITLEWALIANQNDNIETAKELGNLILKYGLRKDMVHVNVIPLNPTDGFENGKPSNIKAVNAFCNCLYNEFSITATPRVRRGIDIDAGCGQLKAKIQKKITPKGIKEI